MGNLVRPAIWVQCEVRPAAGERGRGLFLLSSVARGAPVLAFGGRVLTREEYARLEAIDHCLQVAPDRFLGPSGDRDDFTNHSCAPSTRVEIEKGGTAAMLLALRDLAVGDELTFDYSTVQLDDPLFVLAGCRCGASECRGEIGDFRRLAWRDKKRLVSAGLCAWYVEEAFRREEAARAAARRGTSA